MKKRQLFIIGLMAVIILFSYLTMKFLIAQKPAIPKRPPKITERWVEAVPVKYDDIKSSVVAEGRVMSTSEVEIVAEASGRIESGDVPLKKGQSFSKGQVLLTIYRDEVELELKAQKSQFLNTIVNLLPDIKIDFPERYADFQQFLEEIKLDGTVPPLPHIQSEKLKIFLASRNVLADYFSLKQSELKVSRHTILAPFNGTFLDIYIQAGAYTSTGGRIGKMISTDDLEVEIPVPTKNAEWINIGDPVQLQSVDRQTQWTAKVVRISDFIDVSTQSRSIFVRVPFEKNHPLYSGEFLRATFKGGIVPQVMEIPRNAVFNYDQVFVVNDRLLKIKTAEVVKLNETTALIKGLDEGIIIVVQPLINVAENTPVKILGIDKNTDESKEGN